MASPPRIFAPARRLALRRRMLALQALPEAPRYVMADMVDDVLDRLSFLRVEPKRALVIGDWTGMLAVGLGPGTVEVEPARGFDEEHPFPLADLGGPFDLIASLGTLDTVNDLPGALIHLRAALAPGGLMMASFMASGSLPVLRGAMLTADGDRPAPRIHPQVDVRAGGQLLQRAGFADPVIDSRSLDVRFSSLDRLVGDLRAQGLSNVLDRPGPALGKLALARAQEAFIAAGENGRTSECFEILTLSGWKK